MMTSIMSSSSISSGGDAQQAGSRHHQQKDDSKEEKNDNNCKETNSSSGKGEGDNTMMNKPNCTRQVSSDNVNISARRSLQDAEGLQKKVGVENTSCDQQQQLPDAHQGYYIMASSPTHRQRNSEETIITPTSVRSITLAQLYHQSRRSRHTDSDHTHRRSSNDSISMSSSRILPPPPLVSGSSQEQEKIWMETATAISATSNEEWSFAITAPQLKLSTISQESQTFGSSNSLASIEMDDYGTTCLDDDMTVDTIFEGETCKESPPAA